MRSKEIKKLKVQVAKLTNRSHRQSGKLRNKNPTPLTCSTHMTSTKAMQSPQDSTFNSEVMWPTSLTSVLWDSLSPAIKKQYSRKIAITSIHLAARKGLRKHHRKRVERMVISLRHLILKSDSFYAR